MDKVIEYFGTQQNLVNVLNERFDLNLGTGHVYYWMRSNLPIKRAKQIVAVSDGALTLYDLRPDIFN